MEGEDAGAVGYGTAEQVREQRQRALDAAHAAHPDRFTRRPRAPRLPDQAWINQPTQQAPTVSI
ncbi:hypothetical protein [Solwaraspora sp. WMMA2065]|uniref:hypothetical protein n=1 Tax=Solwaraspora sp. WMMA2065 TaxID=3015166 RepID=UPI00259B139B|nr:hypothetical protein [Solwaraspora sp. WMMA2065]WJK35219.1 hypothetical protein O7610_02160 [Solwaraspora sp. WMMA2065]